MVLEITLSPPAVSGCESRFRFVDYAEIVIGIYISISGLESRKRAETSLLAPASGSSQGTKTQFPEATRDEKSTRRPSTFTILF